MTLSIFDQNLPQNEANHAVLTPLSFIERTAEVYPDHLAVVYGDLRRTWGQTYARCRQLASSLVQAGVGKNDTVAVMLPNTPPMVEAHFGIPMTGAVLNTLNTRLDPETIAFMLDHGEAKVLIVDPEFAPLVAKALPLRKVGRPQDIANAVVFLSSAKAAGHVTGQVLSVSGGYSMIG